MAVQIWVPVQETERISLPGAPVVFAAPQALPFQVLTVSPMVARQKVVDVQETVLMLPPTIIRGDQTDPE